MALDATKRAVSNLADGVQDWADEFMHNDSRVRAATHSVAAIAQVAIVALAAYMVLGALSGAAPVTAPAIGATVFVGLVLCEAFQMLDRIRNISASVLSWAYYSKQSLGVVILTVARNTFVVKHVVTLISDLD